MNMKKLLLLSAMVLVFAPSLSFAYGECSEYGLMVTYNSFNNTCECFPGYAFQDDIFGNPKCTSMENICEDDFGVMSNYNSLSGKCECSFGYVFAENLYGEVQCRSGHTVCRENHGIHSEYDSLTDTCECDDDYTFNEGGECVEKQHNVYFTLLELSTDNREAIISSDYDFSRYHISYGIGCFASTFKRYIGDQIVVNLGTDYDIDPFTDYIVLQDDDETCGITSATRVSSSFTLNEESEIDYEYLLYILENSETYSCPDNSVEISGSCYCIDGYVVDSTGEQCVEAKMSETGTINTDVDYIFEDVSEHTPHAEAINYLYDNDVVSGYSDGLYRPFTNINRAEFTKILVGSLFDTVSGSNCFPDVNNEWFAPYVCKAKDLGIVSGYPDGTFKPSENINIVEALKITLEAYFDSIPDKDGVWYEKYTDFAASNGLMLDEWTSESHLLKRGEMAELIYRTVTNT